jgi:hypothetical protein
LSIIAPWVKSPNQSIGQAFRHLHFFRLGEPPHYHRARYLNRAPCHLRDSVDYFQKSVVVLVPTLIRDLVKDGLNEKIVVKIVSSFAIVLFGAQADECEVAIAACSDIASAIPESVKEIGIGKAESNKHEGTRCG